MIEILHEHGQLILQEGQELPMEENSKKQDANIINIDFSTTFSLPYAPENLAAFNRYGFNKFPCQLYSDGVLIGEYTAKIRENNYNINNYTGSLSIQLSSIYDSLMSDLEAKLLPDALDGIFWVIDPSGVSPDTDETYIHKWLSQEQNTPSGSYPFRFPEYNIIKDYKGSLAEPKFVEDTLVSDKKQGFGSCVPVNRLNNDYPDLPDVSADTPGVASSPPREIKYNILYDNLTYNMNFFDTDSLAPVTLGVTRSGPGYSHFYPNVPQPRRIWSLICPCFPYLWVLEKSLESMGYRLAIEWGNDAQKALFENLFILNNYNIFDIRIRRVEGYVEYWEQISPLSPFNWEDISRRTYWVGDGNPVVPTFTSLPGLSMGPIQEHPTYFVIAKNHVPPISIATLLNDLIAKTNMEVVIQANEVTIRRPLVVQDEAQRSYAPEIKTMENEYRQNKRLKYKYEVEGDDNIPDYSIISDSKDSDDIESEVVPVYLHTENSGGLDRYFCFFQGDPSFNASRHSVEIYLFPSYVFGDNTVQSPMAAATWVNSVPATSSPVPEEDNYITTDCYPVCGVMINYTVMALFAMYFLKGFGLMSIVAPYHQNGQTLKWQDVTGLFAVNYKNYLGIFKSKVVHYFSEICSPQSFQKFSHYKFFALLGRKVFPLKRKMTLPFSKNPLIEYEGYESENEL